MKLWDWFREERDQVKNGVATTEEHCGKWHQDMDRWFEGTLKDLIDLRWKNGKQAVEFQPKIDILETDRNYRVTVEVPGIAPKDLHLHIENHTITLSGEKKDNHEEKIEGKIFKSECTYGSFERVFSLPEDADMDTIQAECANGSLHITVHRSKSLAHKTEIPIKH